MAFQIGNKVSAVIGKVRKYGVITSIANNTTLPIHITFSGEKFETDFRVNEVSLDLDDDSGCDDITNCRPNELKQDLTGGH
jgi:hypothetical protein